MIAWILVGWMCVVVVAYLINLRWSGVVGGPLGRPFDLFDVVLILFWPIILPLAGIAVMIWGDQ